MDPDEMHKDKSYIKAIYSKSAQQTVKSLQSIRALKHRQNKYLCVKIVVLSRC